MKCEKCHFEIRKNGECFCGGGGPQVIMDIQPHFNRGLGEYVGSRSEYRAKLREKGLIEVGNERKYVDPETMRRGIERAQEKALVGLREDAHKMLEHYQWN